MTNFKSPVTPDLSDVLDATIRKTKLSLNSMQIGTIQSFNPSTQLATVKISMKQVISIAEDGKRETQDYPLLIDCPTVTLFGGVDILSMPITAGDSCLVFFNDRDIDYWLNNGDGAVPNTARLHDLSDAIALVGIRPLTNSIANYLANGIRLSHGGGNSQIDLTDNLIETIATLLMHTGNMQVDGDVTINGNITVNGTITSVSGGDTIVYNTHTHSGVTVGGGNTGEPNT